jgi:hypothetical protein
MALVEQSLLKRSIADLVRAGCRVEVISHRPLAVTYVGPDGQRGRLHLDGRSFLIARGDDAAPVARFHSLDAALDAASRPSAQAAS